ncbi:MAG: hypothetical protein JW779_12595 [Candidatus Thorarchaeota archaeon]|nr:hypothetical protein [Candidatus Thorarchaeota archaeon]
MFKDYKTNIQTATIGTHFARMMLLLNGSMIYPDYVVYYGWSLGSLYFILFLIDLIPFLMFWFLRPEWEFNSRIIGLFWVVGLLAILLPTGIGLGLPVVFCIQFLVLIWPKPYIYAQEQETPTTGKNLSQIKCVYCRASYAYDLDSINNEEVICQNCGKSIKI